MALKDILLHLDSSPNCLGRLDLAIDLARAHGARLKGLYVVAHSFYAPRHGGLAEIGAGKMKEMFTEKTAAAGISADWVYVDWPVVGIALTEIITLYAYYTDLVIIGQPDQSDQSNLTPADLPERLGLAAGRPILVVPYTGKFAGTGERIMVGWREGREAVRALNDALPLLEKAKHVSIVSVGSTVVQADESKGMGQQICDHLALHGVAAVHEQIPAPAGLPVGDLLLNFACEQKMDLLVMGGYAQTRRGAFVLGPVAGHLLNHMTLPILLSH